MNNWKVAFFALLVVVLLVVGIALFLLFSASKTDVQTVEALDETNSHEVVVTATKEDLAGIANTFIKRAKTKKPLEIQVDVQEQIILAAELPVFSYQLPVKLFFDPEVLEDGNLLLKQSSVEVGRLSIPPTAILKILRDSVDLPQWMTVQPKEEAIFIDLHALPLAGNTQVEARIINLETNQIELLVHIPK